MNKKVKDQLSLFRLGNIIKKTHLALCCPITSAKKDYPFEVMLNGRKIKGVILVDHLKNLDWKIRKAKFIEKAKSTIMSECIEKITALVVK